MYFLDYSSNVNSVCCCYCIILNWTDFCHPEYIWFRSQSEICGFSYIRLCFPHHLQALFFQNFFYFFYNKLAKPPRILFSLARITLLFYWTISMYIQLKSIKKRKFTFVAFFFQVLTLSRHCLLEFTCQCLQVNQLLCSVLGVFLAVVFFGWFVVVVICPEFIIVICKKYSLVMNFLAQFKAEPLHYKIQEISVQIRSRECR